MADTPPPSALDREIEAALGELEAGLLSLIQNGAQGTVGLDEILLGLSAIVLAMREQYLRLQDILDRRDVEFDVVKRFEAIRAHLLWLYRKAKIERYFFARLRLERNLRDAVHKQIIEIYQEMSELEEAERELRTRPEESLGVALLEEAGDAPIGGIFPAAVRLLPDSDRGVGHS